MNVFSNVQQMYSKISPFHFRIVILFLVLFVICLVITIFTAIRSIKTEQWPPIIANCPDYWVDASGNGGNCVNTKYLGTCVVPKVVSPNDSLFENAEDIYANAQKMDFSVAPYIGSNGLCAKKKWAEGCDLSWNGITFGYGEKDSCS